MPRPKSSIAYHAFSIRLRTDLLDAIREMAREEKRSVNAQIELLLEAGFQQPPAASPSRRVLRRQAPRRLLKAPDA